MTGDEVDDGSFLGLDDPFGDRPVRRAIAGGPEPAEHRALAGSPRKLAQLLLALPADERRPSGERPELNVYLKPGDTIIVN